MIVLITSVLGIIATLVAYNFGPNAAKRKVYAEIDQIYKELDNAYRRRDEALVKNDIDSLTIATADIVRLCQRKNLLLSRLG